MKITRYIAAMAVLGFSFTACTNNSRDRATIGGTVDTMNSVAGANAGGINPASSSDTSNNGNPMRNGDSTSKGNANPSGRIENDSTKGAIRP